MDHLLSGVNYQAHELLICWDLKVVGLVLGLQGGHTKYPCFLFLWGSESEDQHVTQKRPFRQVLKPGLYEVKSHSLVEPKKVLLPS